MSVAALTASVGSAKVQMINVKTKAQRMPDDEAMRQMLSKDAERAMTIR